MMSLPRTLAKCQGLHMWLPASQPLYFSQPTSAQIRHYCYPITISQDKNHSDPDLVKSLSILGETYQCDSHSNVTPRVLDKVGRNLHTQTHHPLNLIKRRIENYFYKTFVNRVGNPVFAVFDNIPPVVTTYQNFDSLLIPQDHISRNASDTYYVNSGQLLRGHTSAHQEELVKMGCDAFLAVGDVYRRDEIDACHYPVFHQMEGVRIYTEKEVFKRVSDTTDMTLFENGKRNQDKQERHSLDAVKLLEYDLKQALLGLAHALFGKNVEYRWVDCYFPFTHPSWELEIRYQGEWLEVLGCGIMEQQLLNNAGAMDKAGWAFGLGLERLAMKLYNIPDIRLFWSQDSGFLKQFKVDNPETDITYKPISQYPQCVNDVSFWLPENTPYCSNDFYDLVRNVGGDLVEQVSMVDEFTHPKSGLISHCYRIIYRHMEKTLTQQEVNKVHGLISSTATSYLGVKVR